MRSDQSDEEWKPWPFHFILVGTETFSVGLNSFLSSTRFRFTALNDHFRA